MATKARQTTDPLADLRPAQEPGLPTPEEPGPPAVDYAGPRDAAWHDAAVTRTVERWHTDKVAQRFAHRGGSCGCRYLATIAVLESVGPVEAEQA